MTLELPHIIGHEIAIADWSPDSVLVFWSACCVSFFGSFRVGEILSTSDKNFDPSTCLLWRDIKFRIDSVHVYMSKTQK